MRDTDFQDTHFKVILHFQKTALVIYSAFVIHILFRDQAVFILIQLFLRIIQIRGSASRMNRDHTSIYMQVISQICRNHCMRTEESTYFSFPILTEVLIQWIELLRSISLIPGNNSPSQFIVAAKHFFLYQKSKLL